MNNSWKRSSNIWICGMSSANHLREPTDRLLKPLSPMMTPHRPARMITWSREIIRLKPTFKKNPAAGKPVSHAQNGLKLQHRRKIINLDNNTRFDYSDDYCSRLIGPSICWAAAENYAQFIIFALYALKKQCLIFSLTPFSQLAIYQPR